MSTIEKRKDKVNTIFPLRLTKEEARHLRTLRDNALNVSQYLRICIRRKAMEFNQEGMK